MESRNEQDEDELVALAKNLKGLYDKLEQARASSLTTIELGLDDGRAERYRHRQSQRALSNLVRYVRGDLSSGGV